MRLGGFQNGPAAAFAADSASAARALRRWAWPLKVGLMTAALVAAIPLLLTAVVAAGSGLLAFGLCRLVVAAGDALGVGGSPTPVVRPSEETAERSNVRVVGVTRHG